MHTNRNVTSTFDIAVREQLLPIPQIVLSSIPEYLTFQELALLSGTCTYLRNLLSSPLPLLIRKTILNPFYQDGRFANRTDDVIQIPFKIEELYLFTPSHSPFPANAVVALQCNVTMAGGRVFGSIAQFVPQQKHGHLTSFTKLVNQTQEINFITQCLSNIRPTDTVDFHASEDVERFTIVIKSFPGERKIIQDSKNRRLFVLSEAAVKISTGNQILYLNSTSSFTSQPIIPHPTRIHFQDNLISFEFLNSPVEDKYLFMSLSGEVTSGISPSIFVASQELSFKSAWRISEEGETICKYDNLITIQKPISLTLKGTSLTLLLKDGRLIGSCEEYSLFEFEYGRYKYE